MAGGADAKLDLILAKLALASSHDEQEELGRDELSSLLHQASADLVDKIVKAAKRDDRLRRCLAAARYYSGLSHDTCARIDTVLKTPFAAADGMRRRR